MALAACSPALAQSSKARSATDTDFSQEAAVIEQDSTTITFDKDGRESRELLSRVRVQTDGGVQEWGLLNLPFPSATQRVEIGYVRVRKPDGSMVETPEDNVQDLDAEITRSAPFYSDLREKHVAVKGLAKGDVLEFQVRWVPIKPLVPGHFWTQYNFRKTGIALDEQLVIKVPADRPVKVKGPSSQTVKTEGDLRIYTWTSAHRQNSDDAENEREQVNAARGQNPPPDVQLSSFTSWEDVGEWYWNLQKERSEPTAAIRAKAAELTHGLTDDDAKLHALYNLVSMHYRYIGISFGIGRYQPHAAEDVLGNNYGDCKDKQTLLAALLKASGITLYPALISSANQLDPDIPSPGQFDHVIGYLPQSNDAVWLDTTPEVAPFGYLAEILRGKQALVMSGEKSARLIATGAEPGFPNTQTFRVEGKLNNDGSLDARIEDTSRGDREVVMRSIFRRIPQPQWKELVQQISYGLGFAGTVSDVTASASETLTEPFRFSYLYNRKDYPDWNNRRFSVPGLPFYMPAIADDRKDPIWLGALLDTTSEAKVELPKWYKPEVPSDVNLLYDFAEYHASYTQDGGALIAKRHMQIKLHEVPVRELDDYRNFVKYLQNDINRYVHASSSLTPSTSQFSIDFSSQSFAQIKELPDSSSSDAIQLENDWRQQSSRFDLPNAAISLQHATEKDPQFTRAWVELGITYLLQRQSDLALDTLRKAIECDPKQAISHKMYAVALGALRRTDEAIAAWEDTLKLAPRDLDAIGTLGKLMTTQRRYSDAVPYYEMAVKIDLSPMRRLALGSAYLKAGQSEKGANLLENAVKDVPTAETMNEAAYSLAEANTDLPKALEYAQKAVEKEEEETQLIELSDLSEKDLSHMLAVGAFWDTLGWVEFRLKHFDRAEDYLNAAWLLSQNPDCAEHLGELYEEQKKTEKAIHMYQLALGTPEGHGQWNGSEDTKVRLEHLIGKKEVSTPFTPDDTGSELSALRSAKLKRLVPGTESAEFFLLFSAGPRSIEDVKFISGSLKLKAAEDAISEARFRITFPTRSSARLVRRAMISCSQITGCVAVLFPPSVTRSVH